MRVSAWVKNRTGMFLLLAGLASALGVAAAAPLLWAEQSRGTTTTTAGTNSRDGRQAALHDQLTAGLKARTKSDRAFVDLVVLKEEQGILSRRLVDSTFLWARKRAARSGSHALRPMVYFRPALILRAKQLGIEL